MSNEHIVNPEVSLLIGKSLQLENNAKHKLFSLINLDIKPDLSDEEVKTKFIDLVSNNENVVRTIKLFLQFDDFSVDLNSIPKHYLRDLVPQRFKSAIKEKSSKEEVYLQIRSQFAKEKIAREEFSHLIEIYKTVAGVERIKDKAHLDLFAATVWPEVTEKVDKKQLIKRLSADMERGVLTPEDVQKNLKTETGKSRIGRSKSENTRDLADEIRSLNAKISLLENEVKKQNEKINKLDILGKQLIQNIDMLNSSVESHFSNIENKFSLGANEDLLKLIQRKLIDTNLNKPGSFDGIIREIRSEKIDDLSFLRDSLSIVLLHYLAGITKEIEWDVSIDQFHRVLCEEIKKLGDLTSSSIEVQKIARPVSDRLNISDEKFDELIVKCYGKDLVRLEVGSPIFDDDARWVKSGNNKYFYVKLLKVTK